MKLLVRDDSRRKEEFHAAFDLAHKELDLTRQDAVEKFFATEKPEQLYLLLLSWNRSWILPVIRLTWIFFSFRFSSFISRISGQLYAQKRQLHILQLPLSHKYMVYMYQIYL